MLQLCATVLNVTWFASLEMNEMLKKFKLELNKYHLKKVTELANKIWSDENIENHFNYFLNELKQDYKFYKKFYKKIEELKANV